MKIPLMLSLALSIGGMAACSGESAPSGSAQKCREGLKQLAAGTKDARLAGVLKAVVHAAHSRGDEDYCSELQRRYLALRERCDAGTGGSAECGAQALLYEAILTGNAKAVEQGVRDEFALLLTFQQSQQQQQKASVERLHKAPFPAVCGEGAAGRDGAELADAAARRAAERFLQLVSTYTTESARDRFMTAAGMTSDTFRTTFEQSFLGAELGLIQNGKRSVEFDAADDSVELLKEGGCRAVFITGTEERRMGGGALPARRKLFRVIVRAVLDPAGSGVRPAIESIESELLAGRR